MTRMRSSLLVSTILTLLAGTLASPVHAMDYGGSDDAWVTPPPAVAQKTAPKVSMEKAPKAPAPKKQMAPIVKKKIVPKVAPHVAVPPKAKPKATR